MFPRERRVQAMGYWSMVGAGGPVIGVVAGGPIVETFGWRWIFIAQVPLTLAGLAARRSSCCRRPSGATARASTSPARASSRSAPPRSSFAINRGPSFGWSNPAIVAGFVLAPLAFVAFVVVERRVEHPLLPLAYLRRRNFSFAIATQFFTNFAYMGGFVITPIFLESVFGYPETRVGGLMIARPLAFAIAGPLAGYVAIRVGERTSAVAGADLRGGLDGGAVDGGARVVRPRDHRRARPVGRRPGLLVTGAGRQHRQRGGGARPRGGRRLPADDDASSAWSLGIQLMQTVTVVRAGRRR